MFQEADFPTDLQALERDYDLVRELGHGGMAAVYLARRRASGELVAIKAIRARYLDDSEVLHRFAREARTTADLEHPNILRTEAIEQIGDRAVAIIMEYIDGGTVRDRLREYGAFSAELTEQVLRDVARALAYAHGRGIVHRDVKPENVFLDKRADRALLADFGIARRIEGEAPLTLLGSALGTPQYMSPEQIDGARVDGRSDIYSVGVLGWELLTGLRPWAGENLYSIIYKQKHEALPPITAVRPRVPANLLSVIERALEKDPARRWQSAEELLSHLTYEPPPVLARTLDGTSAAMDDETTLRFRREPPASAAVPQRERVAPAARPRPVMRTVLLLLPLLIAFGSLYVVLGFPAFGRGSGAGAVTSSSGTVALDSAPEKADTRPTAPRGTDAPGPNAKSSASRPASLPSRPDSPAAGSRADSSGMRSKAASPVKTPRVTATASRADDSAVAREPTPRCRVATVADQRACLLAYIAVNDSALQRVYDSLIVEMRRAAGAPRRSPDPPGVARLRVEQRAWVVARDRECMSSANRPSTRFWARERATCFAAKSDARAAELRSRH